LLILVAPPLLENAKDFFCFAITLPQRNNWENECYVGRNEMAGLKGKKIGPPGNMNAFEHGFAAIQKRREESIATEHRRMSGSKF
jgi:hypothetical protein